MSKEDWVRQVEDVLTPEEFQSARYWYENLAAEFEVYGEDAPRMALAWLLSQVQASPSSGFNNVLRVLDKARGIMREGVPQAGLSEAKIVSVLKGEAPSMTAADKLHDFIDSFIGKLSSTLFRDDPRGLQPAAIDVWAAPDIGFVDPAVQASYSVELDLGEVPRTRALRASDAAGREVAWDEIQINASVHRFATRLIEPRRGQRYAQSLRAEAEVELPEGGALEGVDFYLNETLVATLYQPPFTQPIVLPPDGAVAYVRDVAYQTDGNSTEDLVFVNAPENLEELDVQFVELFTTGPARILRLDRGTLAVGAAADVTVLDLDRSVTIVPKEFRSKSANTPFAGWTLKGAPVMTIVGGRALHDAR